MTAGAVWGAVLGAACGIGVLVVAGRWRALRRTPLWVRVLPYLRDVPASAVTTPEPLAEPMAGGSPARAAIGVFGPMLRSAAELVERVLGGAPAVRRRLQRADLAMSVHDFRVEQVVWGLIGFVAMAGLCLARAVRDPGAALPLLLLCLVAFGCGVLLRENHLSTQVRARERRILQEFPTVAELLALSVSAGESPVAALDRVVRRSGGALSADLARVLAEVRTGESVATAFDRLAAMTGLPLVARFAQGIAVAVERGTPLADVLHAQAADVREAGRRELIEAAARKEVLMMVPVVFLVLPCTVLIAFYPGVVGLNLTVP